MSPELNRRMNQLLGLLDPFLSAHPTIMISVGIILKELLEAAIKEGELGITGTDDDWKQDGK